LIERHNSLLIEIHRLRYPQRHALWLATVQRQSDAAAPGDTLLTLAVLSNRQRVPFTMLHPRHTLVPLNLSYNFPGLVLGRVAVEEPLYGEGRKLNFEFDYLEKFVNDHLVSDKPFIEFNPQELRCALTWQ